MSYGMVPPPPDLNSSNPPSGKRSRFSASRDTDEEKQRQAKFIFLYLKHKNYL